MGINPAALRALLNGDLENAVIASTSGGIEAQEAAGQALFVANETLPRQCGYGTTREQLETIGIVFGKDADDLFVNVQLPDGWHKSATGHSMHNELLDDKGRKRAAIFYKAAFYDRRADISLCCRYSTSVAPVAGYDDPNYKASQWQCIVKDANTVIHTSDPIEPEPPQERRDDLMRWYAQKDELAKTGQRWLDACYPDWRDPVAYWD